MKLLNIKNVLISGLVLIGMTSCEFADTNVDPTNPNGDQVNNGLILPTALVQSAFNIGALGGRMPGIVMQHFTGFDAQQVAYSDYVIEESDLNNLWRTGLYIGSMKDLNVIIAKAEKEGNNFYLGVAKILMAQNLGLATTFFGDIPYREAFQGTDNLTPVYDPQQQVYADIQTLLSEAIGHLTTNDLASLEPSDGDIVFGGDAGLWVKTARALQARYYLQLSKRDNGAAQNALSALNAGTISGNDEIPYIYFEEAGTAANPYAQFGTQRPRTMIVNYNFVSMMDGDPRKDVYMVLDDDVYLFFDGSSSDLFWSNNDSPLPFISYTEIKFIEAEGLLRTGGAGADVALREAIESNFDQLNVGGGSAYANSIATSFNAAVSNEEKMEILITEKYKALYCQAEPEIWADYRRTGYPAITPSPNGANGVNPSGVVPRRFLYPISERQFNDANRQAAIDAQGGHLLDDDMWVFKN